jgi:hypothetical protein
MLSVPRLYNEEQGEILETAVRRVGVWCEMAASLVVSGVSEELASE